MFTFHHYACTLIQHFKRRRELDQVLAALQHVNIANCPVRRQTAPGRLEVKSKWRLRVIQIGEFYENFEVEAIGELLKILEEALAFFMTFGETDPSTLAYGGAGGAGVPEPAAASLIACALLGSIGSARRVAATNRGELRS